MKTIELFCGTKSFSRVAKRRGHETFTLDNDPRFDADVTADVRTWYPPKWMIGKIDLAWFSPPCQGFSVAAIGHNWTGGKGAYIPKSDSARLGIALAKRTLGLIAEIRPRYWVIENPRGVLRKMPFMGGVRRVTVTYCQYGDSRMKPTDLWTNIPESVWMPREMCSNGDRCHEAAPRGAKTGTQGLKGDIERGRIPAALFTELLKSIECHV